MGAGARGKPLGVGANSKAGAGSSGGTAGTAAIAGKWAKGAGSPREVTRTCAALLALVPVADRDNKIPNNINICGRIYGGKEYDCMRFGKISMLYILVNFLMFLNFEKSSNMEKKNF